MVDLQNQDEEASRRDHRSRSFEIFGALCGYLIFLFWSAAPSVFIRNFFFLFVSFVCFVVDLFFLQDSRFANSECFTVAIMTTTLTYPKIRAARALTDKTLLVSFENGIDKIYDCTPLLRSEPFLPLNDEAIFRKAHADATGYGIIWTDDIDLAESEVWLNGIVAEQSPPAYPERRTDTRSDANSE